MKEYDTIFPSDKMINGSIRHDYGINVRDYIAIKAMQGILSNPSLMPNYNFIDMAEQCYKISDTMIEQSEKE
jgi:hypothetical protein